MGTRRLIAIGDNVTDCYVEKRIFYPGGNAVNVAVNARRDGFDEVSYIGVFGDDSHAAHIKESLVKENIDFRLSRTVYAHTAQPIVTIDTHGDRLFKAGPLRSAQHLFKICLTADELEKLTDFSICHTSCYSHLENELPTIHSQCAISFDFSTNYELSYLKKVCPYLTFAFFSTSELTPNQTRELQEECYQLGTKYICCTRGEQGSTLYDGTHFYHQGIKPVEIVDTMGAGDSFIAGFLAAFVAKNLTITQSLEFAAIAAAKSCTIDGGFGYPHPFSDDTLV
ncbi:MAG: PfkB family carbohydrate kinase [Sporolactobacillus sp.]